MTSQEREAKKEDFIKYFEEVPVVKYAAMYIEVTEQTAHNWLNEDKDFLSRVNQAKSKWAKKRALKTRAEFQLERLDKEIWSEEKKIKIEGDPVKEILQGFGLDIKEGDDARQTEGDTETTSPDNA